MWIQGWLRENRAVSVFDGNVEQRCPRMPEMAIFTQSCVGKLPKIAAALFCSVLFCSIQLSSVLFYSILFYSVPFRGHPGHGQGEGPDGDNWSLNREGYVGRGRSERSERSPPQSLLVSRYTEDFI